MILTPATIATSHSPLLILSIASFTATKDDEQAVSIVILGPLKSKKKDILFDNIAIEFPTIALISFSFGIIVRK